MKKILIIIVAALAVWLGWFTISPFFRNIELDEASPIASTPVISDTFDSMNSDERAAFDAATAEMKDMIIEMADVMPVGAPSVLAGADFMPRAHDVTGRAILIENGSEKIIRFEDFETINGPKLNIYLGSDLSNRDFIDLGPIRATRGNVNYTIPAGTDTSKYNKVMVWCVTFGVLFSYADLGV